MTTANWKDPGAITDAMIDLDGALIRAHYARLLVEDLMDTKVNGELGADGYRRINLTDDDFELIFHALNSSGDYMRELRTAFDSLQSLLSPALIKRSAA